MSKNVTIVGIGYVGQGWARVFSSHGWNITIADVRDDLAEVVEKFLPGMKVNITNDLAEGVKNADFIQENSPENLEMKRQILLDIANNAPKTAIIASSTSSILPTKMAEGNPAADRIIVGHPFTPSELPAIEVVPGKETSQATVDKTVEIYKSLDLYPVPLKKEIPGFVGNRLQVAVLGQALYLVQQGVIGPTEFDDLVKHSTGVRYAAVGPFESAHLAGGPAGLRAFFDNILSELSKLDMGNPSFATKDAEEIIAAAEKKYGGADKWVENVKNRATRTKNIFKAVGEDW